jgi:hypothetical protein
MPRSGPTAFGYPLLGLAGFVSRACSASGSRLALCDLDDYEVTYAT